MTVKQTGYTDSSQHVQVTGDESTPVTIDPVSVPPMDTRNPVTVISGLTIFSLMSVVFAFGRRDD